MAKTALKIHRIMFDAAAFANEDSVKSFLTAKGYEDFTVTAKDGGGFMVEDNPADAFKSALRTVEHSSAKGVSYLVGDLKDEAVETKGLNDGAELDAGAGAGTEEGTKGAGTEGAATGTEAGAGTTDAADAAKGTETPAPAASAADTTKAAAPRDRVRFGLVVAGKSANRIVADYEGLVDHVDTSTEKTVKAFADMLANYTGGMPPGLYDMGDALMGELRQLMKTGNADEKKVSALASDFTRGVMAMYGAFNTIMDSATKSAAPGAAPDMEALDALLDAMFGAGVLKSTLEATADSETTKALLDTVTKLSEKTEGLQKAVDGMTLLMLEQAQVADKSDGALVVDDVRVIPERKSATETDETKADAATEAEKAADAARSAKRLGFNYRA